MQRYPTDEELNSFMEELEKEELYAPGNLKEEILLKVREQSSAETAEHGMGHGRQDKRMHGSSFLLYTFKMAAGMAAAVLLVFMIPFNDGSSISLAETPEIEWDASKEEQLKKDSARISLGDRISRYMDEKREENEKQTGKVSEKLDELFNKNDLGGDNYESQKEE